MQHKTIEIKGQKIAYYETRGASPSLGRQTLFFIHGNSSSATTFHPQFESELSNKYRLVAIDLPGHGNSERAKDPEDGYSLRAMASTVVLAAEKLGASNAILIGWSLSGHILIEAMDSMPMAKAFCIYGTPPLGVPPSLGEAFFPSPLLEYVFKEELTDEEIRQWADYVLKPDSELDRQVIADDIGVTDGRMRASVGNSVVSTAYTDEIEILKNLSRPVAIFHGKEERLVNIEYLKNLDIPTLWRKAVQIIPGAGHSPHIEQAKRFNKLLEEFIEDVK